MSTENIIIENLKCGGCANSIIKALTKISGVNKTEVDVPSSTVQVEYTGAIERSILTDKLKQLGYPEVGGENTLTQKAKSFVSCAIGRIQ